MLSLNGSKDVQVPADINQSGIRKALQASGHDDFEIIELPGLNHMFQHSETGSMSEYDGIEETFAPVALEAISAWIKGRIY